MLPDLESPSDAAATVGASLTANLLPGPLWATQVALAVPMQGRPFGEVSLAALATLDALSLVPYAGLSAGSRFGGANDLFVGLVAGLDRRTSRERATGLVLQVDRTLPTAPGDVPAWSAALLFRYRAIVDTLATPDF